MAGGTSAIVAIRSKFVALGLQKGVACAQIEGAPSPTRSKSFFSIELYPACKDGLASITAASCPPTSFCEYSDTKPRRRRNGSRSAKTDRCSRSLVLWTPWRGVRGPKSAPVDGQHEVFGFLTTEPNAVVAPIHPKAMPVTLTTPAEVDLWLLADAPKALELQRPLPDHALRVGASVKRKMARARTPRLAGIKTRCFRFDALPRFQLTQARFAATSNGLLAREAVPRPSA